MAAATEGKEQRGDIAIMESSETPGLDFSVDVGQSSIGGFRHTPLMLLERAKLGPIKALPPQQGGGVPEPTQSPGEEHHILGFGSFVPEPAVCGGGHIVVRCAAPEGDTSGGVHSGGCS